MKTGALPRASQAKPKSRRAIRAALWLGIFSLAWLVFTAIRSRQLLKIGAKIGARNGNFSRDYFVGDPKNAPLLYVSMGDSTAAGWGASNLQDTLPFFVASDLAARGFRVRVVNLAVGGARFEDVQRLQLPALKRLSPDFITLIVGANDAIHFTPLSGAQRDMRLLILSLQNSGARAVLLANTPDISLAPALPGPVSFAAGRRARELNSLFDRALRETKPNETKPNDTQISSVDLFGRGKLNYRRDPQLYAADLFHPSGRGYKVWSGVFAAEIKSSGRF